VKHTRYKE